MKIHSRVRFGSVDIAAVVIVFTFSFMLILFLVIYSIYSYVNLATYAIKELQRNRINIIIKNILVNNTTILFNISNEGPITLSDISNLDIIIEYYANVSGTPTLVTYMLYFNESKGPGTWHVNRIVLEDSIIYNYSTHRYLRPGEVAEIIAYLPVQPIQGMDGLLVVASDNADRTERAFKT